MKGLFFSAISPDFQSGDNNGRSVNYRLRTVYGFCVLGMESRKVLQSCAWFPLSLRCLITVITTISVFLSLLFFPPGSPLLSAAASADDPNRPPGAAQAEARGRDQTNAIPPCEGGGRPSPQVDCLTAGCRSPFPNMAVWVRARKKRDVFFSGDKEDNFFVLKNFDESSNCKPAPWPHSTSPWSLTGNQKRQVGIKLWRTAIVWMGLVLPP